MHSALNIYKVQFREEIKVSHFYAYTMLRYRDVTKHAYL